MDCERQSIQWLHPLHLWGMPILSGLLSWSGLRMLRPRQIPQFLELPPAQDSVMCCPLLFSEALEGRLWLRNNSWYTDCGILNPMSSSSRSTHFWSSRNIFLKPLNEYRDYILNLCCEKHREGIDLHTAPTCYVETKRDYHKPPLWLTAHFILGWFLVLQDLPESVSPRT